MTSGPAHQPPSVQPGMGVEQKQPDANGQQQGGGECL